MTYPSNAQITAVIAAANADDITQAVWAAEDRGDTAQADAAFAAYRRAAREAAIAQADADAEELESYGNIEQSAHARTEAARLRDLAHQYTYQDGFVFPTAEAAQADLTAALLTADRGRFDDDAAVADYWDRVYTRLSNCKVCKVSEAREAAAKAAAAIEAII